MADGRPRRTQVPDEEDPGPNGSVPAGEPGRRGGFDEFFRTEYPGMVSALMLMEGASVADSDDCVAYAMEKLYARWDIPETDTGHVRHPRAYAMTTARHQFRKERNRPQTVALDEAGSVAEANASALTAWEDGQFIANVIECLSPAQRQVMHLITEGYPTTEIAEILRKNPNNIRQIAHQGKKRLRLLLEPPATGSPHGEEEQ